MEGCRTYYARCLLNIYFRYTCNRMEGLIRLKDYSRILTPTDGWTPLPWSLLAQGMWEVI